MPRSIRYFPVNHDINADPEVWELTEQFGDRALRVWLEVLSIADRNKGEIPGLWESYPSVLAGRTKSTTRHLVTVCKWLTRWLDIDSQGVARVRNYSKYHKSRGENSASPNLTYPNLTYIKNKNTSRKPPSAAPTSLEKSVKSDPPEEALSIAQLLSDLIAANVPNRTLPTEAQLLRWAWDAEKLHRLDGHPWGEIRELVEWAQADSFWRANILSIGKLREKWTQLQAKKEANCGGNNKAVEPKGFAGVREWVRQGRQGS